LSINTASCRSLLDEGLQGMGMALDESVCNRLIDYLLLLDKWNRVYNLTAITEQRQMVIQHLLDSLSVLPYVGPGSLLDVGTGAGLPGMVLAIARPELHCSLLDSNSKKTRFLTQVRIELGLDNVEVFSQRVQDHQPDRAYAQIITRAYASLQDIIASTRHCLAADGRLLAMKGQLPTDEIAASGENTGQKWQIQGEKLTVPLLDAERHLLIISGAGQG
jgi:16S rRNA (guanine527-N7)-methyltransferase